MGALAGTANASSNAAGGQVKHEYCVIQLAPLQPHQSVSRVIAHTCSTLRFPSTAAGQVPIITFYQFTNYKGNGMELDGPGTCSAGNTYAYGDTRPSDHGAGNWGASSWQAHSGCWSTKIFYGYNFGSPGYQYAQGVWEAGQIGSPWDNHVWSTVVAY
jgi:hypothetical protein